MVDPLAEDLAGLSDLQLAIMRAVWLADATTVQEVHAVLGESGRELATTTVATLLTRLEKRGLLTHERVGRKYVYRAAVSEQHVRRSMLSRVTQAFFAGNCRALVHHLVDEQISPDELDELKRLIASKQSEPNSKDGR
jgi:predicted transcriptional regulator